MRKLYHRLKWFAPNLNGNFHACMGKVNEVSYDADAIYHLRPERERSKKRIDSVLRPHTQVVSLQLEKNRSYRAHFDDYFTMCSYTLNMVVNAK